MSDAQSTTQEVTLVSGLKGRVRPLLGSELKAVAQPSALRNGDSIVIMLRSCFVEVTDPGPYSHLEEGATRVDWDRLLSGDRFDAIVQLRALTFGDEYDCRIHCASCKAAYDWTIPLGELPRRELPKASRDQLRTVGNRFEVPGPGGETITFRLGVGKDERLAVKLRKQQGGAWNEIDAMMMQILEVEGRGTIESARPKILSYLEGMTWPDVMETFKAMQDADGGIETDVETKCTQCGWEQENKLPFDADFFTRKRRRTAEGELTTVMRTATPARAPGANVNATEDETSSP